MRDQFWKVFSEDESLGKMDDVFCDCEEKAEIAQRNMREDLWFKNMDPTSDFKDVEELVQKILDSVQIEEDVSDEYCGCPAGCKNCLLTEY